ncbi:type IV pilus assembly protein PilP [Allopseudospirillum japonicum]|uniref:Type IV pilus assembly protein PilP n=1 Tax=Allopseudospirillum japonicum TaxID=64971 RepID=A0A1H6QWE7_9GAMM|nr:pilus assembly protein PilP [Allopseudospirillum japonicum]SEI47939.1 type IV pilus assembly protein PilP [Allopseudospirillum japonicum]
MSLRLTNSDFISRCGLSMLLITSLSGCANQDELTKLERELDQIRQQPRGRIEPLPEFTQYQAFTYEAGKYRSPFEPDVPVEVQETPPETNVRPDPTRIRETLEAFALHDLTFVGTLEMIEQKRVWALFRDPQGSVHQVTLNNYIGQDHGRILYISANQVDLVEIVSNGQGGWIERTRSIQLNEGTPNDTN